MTRDTYMRLRSSSPRGRIRLGPGFDMINVFHSKNIYIYFWLGIWFLLVHKQRSKCCLSFETYKENKEREEGGDGCKTEEAMERKRKKRNLFHFCLQKGE